MRKLLQRRSPAHLKSDALNAFDALRVCVVSAHALHAPASSPFVVLRCGGVELRTACVSCTATHDAVWNETLVFRLPPHAHSFALDIDVWNESVLELWADNVVSLADYLGSARVDDASDASRRGVRALRKPLSLRLGLPPPQLGDPAPVQCGELLLELHYLRASVKGADDPHAPLPTVADEPPRALIALSPGAAAPPGTPHSKMTLITVPLFTPCGLCNEICWGVALQAFACSHCRVVFHRRCQQAAALQTACSLDARGALSSSGGGSNSNSSSGGGGGHNSGGSSSSSSNSNSGSHIYGKKHIDIAKKRKKIERLSAEIALESHVTAEPLLELMTWVASSYDAVSSEQALACLLGKPVSTGVIPCVLEALAAQEIFSRLVVIQVLQQLLYNDRNKATVLAKDGVERLLNSLRELGAVFLDATSSEHAVAESHVSPKRQLLAGGSSALTQSPLRVDSSRDDRAVVSPYYELYLSHALAVLAFLACEDSRAVRGSAVDVLLCLCRFQTSNKLILNSLRALLMQFADEEHVWSRVMAEPDAVRVLLLAGESGTLTLHRDIPPSEIDLERAIFRSPLCEVIAARWKFCAVAVKVFDTNSIAWSWDSFFSEVAMLSIAQHRNIVRLYGAHSRPTSLRPYIVMELGAGTVADLVDTIAKRGGRCLLTDALAAHIGAEIASGLALLHARGIVHRDVKTSNFLVSERGEIKLIDFGVSCVLPHGKIAKSVVGTPIWMAPEVLRGEAYDAKADMFSFALVLAHLLTGREPFHDVPPLTVGDAVVAGKRPRQPRNTSPALRVLIVHCWSNDDTERLAAADAAAQLAALKTLLLDVPAPLLSLPDDAMAALLERCSFAMLAQLRASCKALAARVRAYRRAALVPLEHLPLSYETPYDATLQSYSWFHGSITKQQAHALLADAPIGAFLVRASSLPGHWVLCGVFEQQKVLQILATPVQAPTPGFQIDIQGDPAIYPTMIKLIRKYHHVLKCAVVRPVSEPTRLSAAGAAFVTPDNLVRECALLMASGVAKDHRTNPPLPGAALLSLQDPAPGADEADQFLSPRARRLVNN